MARLISISGLFRKSAALFLVEANARRILFDFGDGLEPGEHPDIASIGKVDAVCLSHAHIDHIGSLARLDEVGSPPVYATADCFEHMLPKQRPTNRHIIPEQGLFELFGMPISVGRSGHAPGGVWFHMPTEVGGFVYSGDVSAESESMPFDPMPQTNTLLIDASYGDRDGCLGDQKQRMITEAKDGAVVCCPAAGRGADMVHSLLKAGYAVRAEEIIAREYEALIGKTVPIVDKDSASPDQVIVATGSNGEEGLSQTLLQKDGFRFLFSSHVPKASPAHALIENGQAQWLPWNVHPRLSDILSWADQCEANRVIPAFLDIKTAPKLVSGLGYRLTLERDMEI